MAFVSEKTMFEIYREKEFNKKFRVVYYTELTEHNKEAEINKALAGETIFDGFMSDGKKEQGKVVIKDMLNEMNSSQAALDQTEIRKRLEGYLA